jgi:hypothetical protein|uniref:Uncharacterized protein n=1 Tax=Siphoviridae sp. ctZUr4 TaxID=2827892 RepID=A0A8S5STI5_9CAUD|nr:MAG TPA: hypothetical protein [Siphoviridae sp. ctZUr4]
MGDKTSYIVTRKVNDEIEQVASIDDYNGNIYWTESVESASKFDDINKARKLMSLQEEMGKLLGKEHVYEILEEHRVVSVVKK